MEFTEACAFVLNFGRHRGKTLAEVGASPKGLRYLDWLIGSDAITGKARKALLAYLCHPSIRLELEAAYDD